jgi:hypothetical protein
MYVNNIYLVDLLFCSSNLYVCNEALNHGLCENNSPYKVESASYLMDPPNINQKIKKHISHKHFSIGEGFVVGAFRIWDPQGR